LGNSSYAFERRATYGTHGAFERSSGLATSKHFFWLDYFCLRQLQSDFKLRAVIALVGEIGKTIAAVTGEYLRRSFCVLELFATAKCENAQLVVAQDVGDTLDQARVYCTEKLGAELAETRNPEDKEKIDDFIKREIPGQFDELDVVCRDAIYATCQVCTAEEKSVRVNAALFEQDFAKENSQWTAYLYSAYGEMRGNYADKWLKEEAPQQIKQRRDKFLAKWKPTFPDLEVSDGFPAGDGYFFQDSPSFSGVGLSDTRLAEMRRKFFAEPIDAVRSTPKTEKKGAGTCAHGD
jgi:hypothetical protein